MRKSGRCPAVWHRDGAALGCGEEDQTLSSYLLRPPDDLKGRTMAPAERAKPGDLSRILGKARMPTPVEGDAEGWPAAFATQAGNSKW